MLPDEDLLAAIESIVLEISSPMVGVGDVASRRAETIALVAPSFHCHAMIAKQLAFGCRTRTASGMRAIRASLRSFPPGTNSRVSSLPVSWMIIQIVLDLTIF